MFLSWWILRNRKCFRGFRVEKNQNPTERKSDGNKIRRIRRNFSSDKSTSSHTSSNSSSSSSKSSRHSKSSPQVAMKSPPQRCQPLYSTATKLNSPTNIEIFPPLQHHLQHPLQHPPPHLHLQYQPIIIMLIFLGK